MKPLRLDGSRNSQAEAGPRKRQLKVLKQSYLKGDHQTRVHSDQMVLIMVKQEAGPCERWPKMLNRELQNNSRQPTDLVVKLA